MSALQKGSIYQHLGFGMIEFVRVDSFHGEHTLQFRQISTGRTKYLFPHEVEKIISDQKSDQASRDITSWEARAIKEASRAEGLQAQVDELLEELTITLGSLKEICSVRQIPRPESTIRRAESVINKTTGETK